MISTRHLPEILDQIRHEVTDHRRLVPDVNECLQQQAHISREDCGPTPGQASLTLALEHAKRTLLALESLIADKLTANDIHNAWTRSDQILWPRIEPKVKSLKDDIHHDRVSSAFDPLAS